MSASAVLDGFHTQTLSRVEKCDALRSIFKRLPYRQFYSTSPILSTAWRELLYLAIVGLNAKRVIGRGR